MKRETVKALLENGVLQAYADGKEIQYQSDSGLWLNSNNADFSFSPNRYRIKPTPQFKVGDLVRNPNGTVCKVKESLRDEICRVTPLGRHYSQCFPMSELIPVREVRTPLTFKQAAKLVTEKGVRIQHEGIEKTITAIDYNSVFVKEPENGHSKCLLFSMGGLQITFPDGTPFANVTYEDVT